MPLSVQQRQEIWHARHRLSLYRSWRDKLAYEAFEQGGDNDGSQRINEMIREAADDLDRLCDVYGICGHMDCMDERRDGSLFCDHHRRP